MEISEFLQELSDHNKTGKGFQIQLNSGNLDEKSNKNIDVEFGDLYFTNFKLLRETLLCFDNMNRKPIDHKPDGTNLYPMEINSEMFLEVDQIECVEEVQDKDDWLQLDLWNNYIGGVFFNMPPERRENTYIWE